MGLIPPHLMGEFCPGAAAMSQFWDTKSDIIIIVKRATKKLQKKIKKLLKNLLTNSTKCAIIIKVSEREPTPQAK